MTHHWHLPRQQVRAIDQYAAETLGIPTLVLMENAGRGCADLLLQKGVAANGPVCICCGRGNNGGDGFVMARHLEVHEIPTEVFLFDSRDKFRGDALANLLVLEKIDVPIHELKMPDQAAVLGDHLARASWVVDALLGTGASGPVKSPYDSVIQQINAAGVPVMSIDLPSGMDCDTGHPGEHCVRATITATFVAHKAGFACSEANPYCGEVHVLQIGIPRTVVSRFHGCEENLVSG